jgi:hypothetical protein
MLEERVLGGRRTTAAFGTLADIGLVSSEVTTSGNG